VGDAVSKPHSAKGDLEIATPKKKEKP